MSGFLPRLEWGMSIEGFIWVVRAEFCSAGDGVLCRPLHQRDAPK